ncbi:MAG: hypothetical protein UY23_C0005G0028 [Candidatus Jorgensenbacteria bacterium GW2011_GWA1_48_11]|uniref:Uncharacterized protein n=1 Tax=Candidatus Jorgensenbacteria bacterium GW2011_GWA1_48_11 TaxID=1618660 RepID=A0A0G1U9Y1_9BACT|nr:MAG: hypothetical protein UY23_C0005G0028 [Candidatus Jorgensenbacteria bacterium GW2011_GWA1_48_11]KKW12337.1 MAG: hypothetical protein UY51_C0005G0579 [Candidatus Jorgensenbacteria bacterium GW2011_GWB1_49_9]
MLEKPPKNQESAYDRIKNLTMGALEKLGDEGYLERILAFAKKLQGRHPDFQKYKCYHALIGSTPPPDSIDGDFEGEDSVEEFFQSILLE